MNIENTQGSQKKVHTFENSLHEEFFNDLNDSNFRPRLHGIGSKWNRIHLDPIHFLRGVYTWSDPELLAFTRDRIHLDFMNS